MDVRHITRWTGAAAFALVVLFSGTALASTGRAGSSSPTGGAALGGASSSQRSSHKHKSGARKTVQVSDVGHQYPGDSEHLGDRILREGMSGHDVRVLQDFLTRAGFSTPIVGNFGPTTKHSVIAFQQANGLTPDGVVTWSVSEALRAAVGMPATSSSTTTSGSATTAPVAKATISNGLAIAPADAPQAVKDVIAAGNKIAFKPYIFGGGHGSFNDSGYDCSGSVSYALHGAALLSSPEDSSQLESYGRAGRGSSITIWANAGHVYMYVAGLRFDTGAQNSGGGGSRWTTEGRSSAGYVERHPSGF